MVCFRFVFTGNPHEVERSDLPKRLAAELEKKKSFFASFFGAREVRLGFDFRTTNWATSL
jgi:hypothetical protein